MMQFLVFLAVFLLGLCAGSFLNAFLHRLERGESAFHGRSRCPKCSHQLSWPDLIPLASFVLLGGKCRYCGASISWQYPLVEFATAALFLLMFNSQFLIPSQFLMLQFLKLFCLWFIGTILIGIFVYDLQHFIIPDKLLYPAIVVALLYQVLSIWHWDLMIVSPLIVAIFASAFFFAIHFLSKGTWMGFGDGKLVFLLGLLLEWPQLLLALFLAFFSGAIAGIILIVLGKKSMRSEVPFGPFLIGGALFSLFFGAPIVSWYAGLLGI